jgi:aspartate kinase
MCITGKNPFFIAWDTEHYYTDTGIYYGKPVLKQYSIFPVIPSISYLEAMELSFFGAKVLHPRSLEPAMRKQIPIRVKNTFNPSFPGTLVFKEGYVDRQVVKAVTIIEKVALVNITGVQMIGRPGVARTIFTALSEKDVNVMMISQGSCEANISFVVRQEDGPPGGPCPA